MIKKLMIFGAIVIPCALNSQDFQDAKRKILKSISTDSLKNRAQVALSAAPVVTGSTISLICGLMLYEEMPKMGITAYNAGALIIMATASHAAYKGAQKTSQMIKKLKGASSSSVNTSEDKFLLPQAHEEKKYIPAKLKAALYALASLGGIASAGIPVHFAHQPTPYEPLFWPVALTVGATGLFSSYHCLQDAYDILKKAK